ncbi:MAG: glycerol-3-phosphate acyltransferase [Sodalis sp. (in: enterobacteria)]
MNLVINAMLIGMIIFAYRFGSAYSALLIRRLVCLPNLRTSGSSTSDTTNVLRFDHKLIAAGVMVFDILKGLLPVSIGYGFKLSSFCLDLVATAAYFRLIRLL